jgi:hypothetical protein
MVSSFWIITAILISWLIFGIVILTPLLWRLYLDHKLFHPGIQVVLYVYFTIVLILAILMVVYQPAHQGYHCGEQGCEKVYCVSSDPGCLTMFECSQQCHVPSLYIIQAYTENNHEVKYLTANSDGLLTLEEPDDDNLYTHQMWELYTSNNKPYFIDYSDTLTIQLYFRSTAFHDLCIGNDVSIVPCTNMDALVNFLDNSFENSDYQCLGHLDGIITRTVCSLGAEEWKVIPID